MLSFGVLQLLVVHAEQIFANQRIALPPPSREAAGGRLICETVVFTIARRKPLLAFVSNRRWSACRGETRRSCGGRPKALELRPHHF